jgi:N-acetylneuraminic acid mutarotase
MEEPSPRWGQQSTVVEEKLCIYGGRTKDFRKELLALSIQVFDPLLEVWTKEDCNGVPPPGIYDGACASTGHHFYVYGGNDGKHYHGSLYQLDTRSLTWALLSSDGPMKQSGCRMVAYDNKLVLFGGDECPSDSIQTGAEFNKHSDGRGRTNDLHIFDLKEGKESNHA